MSSYWPGRKPIDGEINLNGSVFDADRLVRATTKPYPGAYFFRKNLKIIIWRAHIQNTVSTNDMCLKFKDGFLILEDYEKFI